MPPRPVEPTGPLPSAGDDPTTAPELASGRLPDAATGDPRPGRAVVVGGSSAIGRTVAVELAGLGYEIEVWGRDVGRLAAAVTACRAAGVAARSCSVQLEQPDSVRAALARSGIGVPAPPGTLPLRVVVWAAGVFDWAPADEGDPDIWSRLLEVNLVAAARVTTAVLPALAAAAPSALVYLGSTAAHLSFPNNAAYVASKHGLAGLAEAVFLDVRDRGVKVSLVSPGLVAAGAGLRSPAGRQRPETLLDPADVAAAVRFVVTYPARGCPTLVRVEPQRSP
ncbi:SDR family oxidoreductase [Nakamurella endophytica]|uniref:Oxidoreductase n=1 Tax=Nakamurella endophytica TaxID=1748367 RepID=A0A917T087_9ACTN|nr:SDR family oxidoreductase [Nakamurella endophytica]GGM05810.1 oxidoreductase [Nakamurella endophytica]